MPLLKGRDFADILIQSKQQMDRVLVEAVLYI